MPASANLILVAQALAPIRERRIVFVGASILPILINDPAAAPPRATIDVDTVVDIVSYGQWERLRMRLRECGLVERADARAGLARKCLFYLGDILVDVMPPHVPELDCPSRMLALGFEFAIPHLITDELEILTLSAPGLLAAKLEAFFDRRAKTFKDLDDIVAILDGRLRIAEEIMDSPAEMRWFIANGFRSLLADGHVLDIISDTLREPTREKRLLEMLHTLSARIS